MAPRSVWGTRSDRRARRRKDHLFFIPPSLYSFQHASRHDAPRRSGVSYSAVFERRPQHGPFTQRSADAGKARHPNLKRVHFVKRSSWLHTGSITSRTSVIKSTSHSTASPPLMSSPRCRSSSPLLTAPLSKAYISGDLAMSRALACCSSTGVALDISAIFFAWRHPLRAQNTDPFFWAVPRPWCVLKHNLSPRVTATQWPQLYSKKSRSPGTIAAPVISVEGTTHLEHAAFHS